QPIDPLNSVTTLTTLIDSQSIPFDTPIMNSTPSNIINNETTISNHCAFESPSRFTVLGDGVKLRLSLQVRENQNLLSSTRTWNSRQYEEKENVAVTAVAPIISYCLYYY
ncbi:hypothetical protein HID58_044128, partial [Brassica napus]